MDSTCGRIAPDQRSAGHLDHKVASGVTVHAFAFAVVTTLSDEARLIELINQVVKIVIRLEDHVPAVSSITAIRSSLGPESFSTKRDAAAAAVTGAGKDLDLIDEHAAGSKKARRMASPAENQC
jgi:hypothetical protein